MQGETVRSWPVWGPKTSNRFIRECRGIFLRSWCGLYISICVLHRWRLLRGYPNWLWNVCEGPNVGWGRCQMKVLASSRRHCRNGTSCLRNACYLLPLIKWCGIPEHIHYETNKANILQDIMDCWINSVRYLNPTHAPKLAALRWCGSRVT